MTRDPVETARTLERWLSERLGGATVEVDEIKIPAAGFSNETILGRARWQDAGAPRSNDFVLRIEPTSHQLFVEPDALRQAAVMTGLSGKVPVPRVWLTEADPGVLGAAFYLMDRIDGRIPGDVPSWLKKGWVVALGTEEQSRLVENSLAALVQLHEVDPSVPELGALREGRAAGSALNAFVERIATFHDWCEPVLRYARPLIDEALAFVVSEQPIHDEARIVWGDARVGNIIYADDLSVAAMLDWEGATLGPREIDIAWWVMFDEFLCETLGFTRPAGIPDRRRTLDRYQELAGVTLRAIDYYEVLAGLQFCLINSRLADLLIRTGRAPEEIASTYVTRAAGIMDRAMQRSTEGTRS